MRDLSVELMRCIACVFVVGVHMFVSQQFAGVYVYPRVFASCTLADGVTIFWMITGFFMFGNRGFKKMLKRTATKILVPMTLLSLFAFFLFEWYAGFTTLGESVIKSPDEIKDAVYSIFEWHNGIDGTDHLWYLYTYILLVITYPLLSPFTKTLTGKRPYYLLAAIFAVFFFNDLAENRLFEFSTRGINALVPAALQVLWGYVLYQKREDFRGNQRIGAIAIIGFFVVNAVRAAMLMYNYEIGNANHFLFWHSAYALLTSSCVIIACFAFVPQEAKGGVGKAILEAGACTFLVYVIHMVIRDIIVIKYENPLYDFFFAGAPDHYGIAVMGLDIVYMVVSVAIVFFTSLAIVFVGRKLSAWIKRLYCSHKAKAVQSSP